ncbi:hypothetical protein ACJIZ3_014409 [Penstemon smallii]|uniref:Uncharacterized protein n=1 Tax=Penstemon smallii TaxID=265156 RepID=A0ABD3RMQ9_9LAMI
MRLDLLQQTNHPCKGIFLELPQVGKRRLGFLNLVSITSTTTTTTTIQISQRVMQDISQNIHPTIAMPIPQNGLQSHVIIVSQRHKLLYSLCSTHTHFHQTRNSNLGLGLAWNSGSGSKHSNPYYNF